MRHWLTSQLYEKWQILIRRLNFDLMDFIVGVGFYEKCFL